MEQEHLFSPVDSDRPKVLCIDDDPEVSRALGIRLGNHNVEVLRAFHGMQGFWLALTEKPDLIITDLRMPQGEGDYVVECLKGNADTRHIPVFVLTGRRDKNLQRRMQNLGVDDYFLKPIDFDLLRDHLKRFIPLAEDLALQP